jgi:hypothetical protein
MEAHGDNYGDYNNDDGDDNNDNGGDKRRMLR